MTSTELLTTEHLRDIQNAIWCARIRWYYIGIGLEIDSTDLDVIKVDNHFQTDDCFSAMLRGWLNKSKPEPTWKAMADALKLPAVGAKLTDTEGTYIIAKKCLFDGRFAWLKCLVLLKILS